MKKLKNNIFVKMGIIVILILLLLIPTNLIKELVYEREQTQKNAIAEVSHKWGSKQTITGPYISIPYNKYSEQYDTKKESFKTVKVMDYLHILPENLNISGSISPEKMKRGIYEIVVYESSLKLEGNFEKIDLSKFDIETKDLHLDKAFLNVGISDLKGIEKQMILNWDDESIYFNPGIGNKQIARSGVNAPIKIDMNSKKQFSFDLELNGSQHIYFVPVGKTTDVNLTSNWPSPKFDGAFLPDDRNVVKSGFSANWNIFHLNRNFPQMWKGNNYNLNNSTFGTILLLPVDNYQKTWRVVKYAILFLALTFMVFFFVEVLNKVFIHPIQYLLVGLGLVLFFSLLLSFSEHFIFNTAYIISTILTLSLISSYTYAILKSKNISFMILGILLVLYSFIFTIIQMEGYALLFGSLGLFIILALIMYFSRKIDWYKIQIGIKEKEIQNAV